MDRGSFIIFLFLAVSTGCGSIKKCDSVNIEKIEYYTDSRGREYAITTYWPTDTSVFLRCQGPRRNFIFPPHTAVVLRTLNDNFLVAMDPFKGTHKGLVSMSGKIIFDLAYYEIYALPNDEYVGIVFPRWDDSKVFVDVYCGNYKKKKETIVFDLASLESYYMTSQCEYPIFETWIINDYYGNTVTGLFLKGLYHATRLEFVSACDYFKHVMSMTKGSPADSLGSELYSVSEKNIKAIRKYCIEH